jgi:hypothetical protein
MKEEFEIIFISFSFTIEKCFNKDLGTNFKVLHLTADVSTRKSGRKQVLIIPNLSFSICSK